MKDIKPENYRISKRVKLTEIDTKPANNYDDDVKEERLREVGTKLAKLQEKMYAHNRYGVLICFQGMDTSGKDSLIREVFKEFNPRGVIVHSFKVPNDTELQHDYLWRHYIALPERGTMAVFNRTHYENVLVTRVHPEYILSENLPDVKKVEDIKPDFWQKRMEQINNFEKHLVENGTIVLKFLFHMSKEEQRERLLRRLEEEKHNWKFSPGDLKEREHWDEYMKCYEDMLNKTSTPGAPWFVVPADDKEMCRCIVAEILLSELEKYEISFPELDEKVKDNISVYRKQLESER
ncbi:MAG: polyphosphate kinase 2 family protein [Flavobacterium sp.]|nr:MAG: polyphosphate kinase 2 family protein [Flavobacterium sp.]